MKLGLASDKVTSVTLATFDKTITDTAVVSHMDITASQFLQVVLDSAGRPYLATITILSANASSEINLQSLDYAPLSLF